MNDSFVKLTYDNIANDFNLTRYNIWNCVKIFLNNIDANSIIGDIGCGNGKNMLFRKDCINIGCDFSQNLVNLCKEKNLDVVLGNILDIPFQDNIFDYTICVAVIHHLSTKNDRIRAIKELLRVTKIGGKIFILVWAFEQEKNSKRKFIKQDNLIDWKNSKKEIIGKRYYYVFKKNELENLIDKKYIVKSFFEKGNWGVILKKI